MNNLSRHQQLSQIFEDLANEIAVPPSRYQEAKDRYDAVGAWLDADGSELAPYKPIIYPQGSFALGTAVRPIGSDEYDVDAVCQLQLFAYQVTQKQLKNLVGDRLKHPQSRYKDMIDPKEGGRRCWTIHYAESTKFHLDVLPAIPDDYRWLLELGVPSEWAESAICITDSKTWDVDPNWPRSNPKGYAAWFKSRMQTRLYEAKYAHVKALRRDLDEAKYAHKMEIRAAVEEIEDFEVRTPLQELIQILKRHRDMRYNGDDDKPISIIITTLAAQAYNNEASIGEAILNVVPCMRSHIEYRNGVFWVPNPVNPQENFADKWAEKPRKAQLFFQWLNNLEQEYRELLTDAGFEKVGGYLVEAFGQRDGGATMAKFASRASQGAAPTILLTPSKSQQPTKPSIEVPSNPNRPWGV